MKPELFLKSTIKKNPQLIKAACMLHRRGLVPPNTYIVDIQAVSHNARVIAESAAKNGLNLYFMTKQFGRNPEISRSIVEAGIKSAVAVDFDEARQLYRNGIPLGHVGHLVQVPSSLMDWIISTGPEVVTCFSVAKAKDLSDAATKAGKRQDILLRVISPEDFFYPTQRGGIPIDQLPEVIDELKNLPGIRIAGVTSFPCLIMNEATHEVQPTHNVDTLVRAVSVMRSAGIEVSQVNGPSLTCSSTMALLKSLGITHGEPGHALTGTTPLHALTEQPELPAMVYVSEVSHVVGNEAFVFGGGFYARSHLQDVLIGDSPETIFDNIYRAQEPCNDHIDYYLPIPNSKGAKVGDTAIFAFRTQVFVTRSYVAVVDGIQDSKPRLSAIYDSRGELIQRLS